MSEKERSAGIILFHLKEQEPYYLLLHYPGGHWDYVKGKRESGETARETAMRECQEETGIRHVRLLEGFEESVHYFFKRGENVVEKDVLFFVGMAQTTRVTLSHEHKNHQWLPYEEAHEQLTFANAKKLLEKAQRFIASQ